MNAQPDDDLSNHFTRLVAPFLAGFSLPTIAQLVTGSSPPQPWRDIAIALFVTATGCLIAGFQLSIGSLYKTNSTIRPLLTFAGLAAITLALIVLIVSVLGIAHWLLLLPAVVILVSGVFVPIAMRIANTKVAGGPLDRLAR